MIRPLKLEKTAYRLLKNVEKFTAHYAKDPMPVLRESTIFAEVLQQGKYVQEQRSSKASFHGNRIRTGETEIRVASSANISHNKVIANHTSAAPIGLLQYLPHS